MVVTSEEYNPGDVFYIYEIRNGWARVYSLAMTVMYGMNA